MRHIYAWSQGTRTPLAAMKGGACVSEDDLEERPASAREASPTGGKLLRSAVPGLALFCVNITLVVYLAAHFVGLAYAGHAGHGSTTASPTAPAPVVATATDTVAPLAETPVAPEQSPTPTAPAHAAVPTATPAVAATQPPPLPTAKPTTVASPQPTATPTLSPIG